MEQRKEMQFNCSAQVAAAVWEYLESSSSPACSWDVDVPLAPPALLCANCCELCCTADTAGTYHTPLLATVPTGVWSTGQMGISGSESLMWLLCLPWASTYCFEHLTCFSLEGLLIFFLPKLGLPTWIFLPLKCCCEKSVRKGTEFITPHKLQSCGSPFFFELCLWTSSAQCTTCKQQTHSAPLEIQLFCPLYC